MKGTRSALRYAKAILNLAKETGKETEVNNNMQFIAKIISENKDLDSMLKSPIIKISDKKNVLNALFSDKINNISLGLFSLLEENKRMVMLASITKQYTVLYNCLKKIQIAKVTTAVPLTKTVEEKITTKIIQLTGNSATIKSYINPAILGGFILRVGDIQYDASISNHFKELRKEFDNNHYISKI